MMRTNSKYRLGGKLISGPGRRFLVKEDGSFTVFGLFVFLMILMISGLAVDLMQYEHKRVAVQNTLDTAVVAATRLNQDANTNAEVTALVKDYFSKAGFNPDIVNVNPNIEVPAGGDEETLRTVSAVVEFDMDTTFMTMLGIDTLPGAVGGGAREGQQLTEVALILDISGSMGWGSKLDDMKAAARSFVTTLIENNGEERVMISIIPYNAQVQISSDLASRLGDNLPDAVRWANTLTAVEPVPTHAGAVDLYNSRNASANCARFLDADFDTRALGAGNEVNPSAKFSGRDHGFGDVPYWSYWCREQQDYQDAGVFYPEMLLYQNDETKIHAFIDSLQAGGWTAIDYGMKWGVGVLDPTFRPIIQDMLADSQQLREDAQTLASTSGNPYVEPSEFWLVPDSVAGHPVNYGTENVFKYVVVMTDGANTEHQDLKEEFKSGPTRIWYSEQLVEDAGGDEWAGYIVEMPDNLPSQRWFRPNSPFSSSDHEYGDESWFASLDEDRVNQWTYHKLYERFSVPDAAEYFFQFDSDAETAHANAIEDSGGYGTADTNLDRICDVADDTMTVFAVAFEAPAGGVTALQDCVNNTPGRFFITTGSQLTAAFNAIAAEITKLRLTQ